MHRSTARGVYFAALAALSAQALALRPARASTVSTSGSSAVARNVTRSARRFQAHVLDLGLDFEELALPNLVADVDTLADLERLGPRGGARTRALVEAIVR